MGTTLRTVFSKTLYDQRRALLWWGLGFVCLGLYVVYLFPSIQENAREYDQLLRLMPDALVKSLVGEASDFSSPAGYLNSTLF